MYNNFLIIPNPLKRDSIDFVSVIADYLANKNKKIFVPDDFDNDFGNNVHAISAYRLSIIDMAVILGGDGTFLNNVSYIKHLEIPVFGINFGHLGYLTQCDPSEAFKCLDRVISGDFEIENRIMLTCTVENGDECVSYTGVNEVVLHRQVNERALHINVRINGNLIENFYADGVLVSTPTGSTAYNMSAGGPVVVPTANNFVITPICAPKADCSIVSSADDEICISLGSAENNCEYTKGCLSVDSIDNIDFGYGTTVTVKKSKYALRLVRFSNDSFYQTLKYKLYKSI